MNNFFPSGDWLRLTLNATKSGLWAWDVAQDRLYWSEEVYQMYGLPPDGPPLTHEFADSWIHPADRETVITCFRAALAQRQAQAHEFRIITPDGQVRWVRDHWQLNCGPDGALLQVSGVLTDITEQKTAEATLRHNEERYRELFENATDIFYTHDLVGNFTSWNKAGEQLTGYTREDSKSLNIQQLIAPESLAHAQAMTARKFAQGGTTMYEIDLIGKQSQRISVEVNSRLRYEEGRPVAIEGIARDVTARKQAEEAARHSQQRYQELVNTLNGIVWEADLGLGVTTFISPQVETILGYSQAAWLADNRFWANHLHPADRDWGAHWQERAAAMKDSFEEAEYRMITADGRVVWIRDIASVTYKNGAPVKMCGLMTDITAHRRAQEALAQREQRYRALVQASAQLVWLTNADGSELKEAEGPTRLLSPDWQPAGSRRWFRPVHPADRERVIRVSQAAWAQGTAYEFEYQTEFEDGQPGHLLVRGVPVRDAKGRLNEWIGTCTDITEQKRAELALRLSEMRFRRIFDQSPIGISLMRDGQILYANPSLVQMMGYSNEDEIIGQPALNLIAVQCRDIILEYRRRRLAGEKAPNDYETVSVRKDGTEFPAHVQIVPMELPDGPAWLVFYTNLTTRYEALEALRKSEEQLRLAQRMESIGRLAGGVAHDFNNLLAVINGYSDLLMRQLEKESSTWRKVEQIHKAGLRAAGLTRQLLAFSRKQILRPRLLDFNLVISDIQKILQRLIGEDVELVTALRANLWTIKADPGQLEQVLLNLAVNARDAMPQGGKIRMVTENIQLASDYVLKRTVVTPGRYVLLTFSDNGCGMDKITQERIFEPFFTTKEAGKGTGLGLSTVYGIIKQSGGYIWVYSEQGLGATFKIYLPAVDVEVTVADAPRTEQTIPATGTETVLVVEDDASVRGLVRMTLEINGYRVLEAENGPKALALCQQTNEPINLLLTDVVMPQMSGREVAARLTALRPGLRVLFMSGYPDEELGQRGILETGVLFIEKPFSPRDLAQKVRGLLDERQ